MQKLATLVIAENNEGTQLNDSLDNLLEYSDHKLYDIIVVSDGSEIPVDLSKYGDLVRHVAYPIRKGVGAAFDIGAEHVKTPNMFIMGSDIRFRDKDCIDNMLNYLETEDNNKSFICTTNLGISVAAGKTIFSEKLTARYAAKVLLFMKAADLPQKGTEMKRLRRENAVDSFRNILEAKWLSRWNQGIYEVPCVLGAFYGVKTDWYNHIGGFHGHRYWGTLEPFISLKSWLAGGSCKIASDIETGHLFKSQGSHYTRMSDTLYNKYAVTKILFGKRVARKFFDFLGELGDNPDMKAAKWLAHANRKSLRALHKEFLKVKSRDIHWFNERFPFKYYDVIKNTKDDTMRTKWYDRFLFK